MANLSNSGHHTRREFLKNAARLGVGAATLAMFGPRSVKTVSAQIERPEQISVMIADLIEETAPDFARGQMQGTRVVGDGTNATIQAPAGGEFVSGILNLPFPATHVGLHWTTRDASPESLAIAVRSRRNGHTWSDWQPLNIEAVADLSATENAIPVHGHASGDLKTRATRHYEIFASLTGVDRVDNVQYRAAFPSSDSVSLESMTVTAINSADGSQQMSTTSAATQVTLENAAGISINVTTREGWGADESLRSTGGNTIWPQMYVPAKKVFLHHTATSNNYTNGAAEVRAIYTYHARTLGWGDIGYNILVDRFGNIYEGRHGRGEGSTREILGDDVVAGHVYAYNYGTTGIAAIGDSDTSAFSWYRSWGDAGLKAIEDAVAFECGRQYLHPQGASNYLRSDGIWHEGLLQHCVGHRDADGNGGATACPGSRLYNYLNTTLRDAVANRLIGANPPALSGTQDGSNLTFDWSGAGEYWYCLEGWHKAAGEGDITYLSGYVDQSETYNDPLAMAQEWAATAEEQKTFSVSEPGHYTMHVRAKSGDYAHAAHLTFRVTEITEAPTPSPTGTISGTVTDAASGDGIPDATVTVEGTGLSSTTGADGLYTIAEVPEGEHSVTASTDGYTPETRSVTVIAGDTATADFTLVAKDEEAAPTMHIADLTGTRTSAWRNWVAYVTVTVNDSIGNPVAGASVFGKWTGGYVGDAVCETGSNGTCTVSTESISNPLQTVTFTVNDVKHGSFDYDDSGETTITISYRDRA